jgi:hypothetical protein
MPAGPCPAGLLAARIHPKHSTAPPLEKRWNVCGFKSPWYITFDHRIPGKPGDLVVAAFWVNRMKTYLTEEEFRAVVMELADHIRSGTEFNKAVVDAARYRISAMRPAPRSF